jgi:hypothetical protein
MVFCEFIKYQDGWEKIFWSTFDGPRQAEADFAAHGEATLEHPVRGGAQARGSTPQLHPTISTGDDAGIIGTACSGVDGAPELGGARGRRSPTASTSSTVDREASAQITNGDLRARYARVK